MGNDHSMLEYTLNAIVPVSIKCFDIQFKIYTLIWSHILMKSHLCLDHEQAKYGHTHTAGICDAEENKSAETVQTARGDFVSCLHENKKIV